MQTILLDVYTGKARAIEIEDDLHAFYDALHVEHIDITERMIGGRPFDVMCDDEGLLKGSPEVSAIDSMGNPMFVGSLMFFHHTDEGELVGLTPEDILHLRHHIRGFINVLTGKRRMVMCDVDYHYWEYMA